VGEMDCGVVVVLALALNARSSCTPARCPDMLEVKGKILFVFWPVMSSILNCDEFIVLSNGTFSAPSSSPTCGAAARSHTQNCTHWSLTQRPRRYYYRPAARSTLAQDNQLQKVCSNCQVARGGLGPLDHPPNRQAVPNFPRHFAPPFPPIDCRELPPDRPSPAPICSVSNRKIVSRLLNCQILRCIRKSRQTLTFPLEAISFFPIPHPNLDHALPLNRIAATSPPCPSSLP
jgi:hypothetical protein